jgi:zinc transporter 1/2/3
MRMSQNNIVFVILKQFGTGIILSTAFIHVSPITTQSLPITNNTQLFTHADLMFGNKCLGELDYEGTTAAIFLAGLFLSFLVDYLGARFVLWRQGKRSGTDTEVNQTETHDTKSSAPSTPDNVLTNGDDHETHGHGHVRMHSAAEEKLNVLVLEAGIIFHSLRK